MLTHQFVSIQKPSRVVILGAKGFLASALIHDLEMSNINCRPAGSAEADLTDSAAVEKLGGILSPDDVLVFPAALTPDKGRDAATLMQNLRMAEHVSAVLARVACAHLVYISSDAVYDWRSSLINEESSCEPIDLYALMHIARERMLSSACRNAKIPFAAIRPCAVYGPGDTHNSYGPNRFIRNALAEGVIRLFGEGEEQRDHVYVRDVAEIVRLCILHRSAGILNAVSGCAISFRSLAARVAAAVARAVRVECQPRSGPVTHRHFDITALACSFPSFRPTTLETGIAQSIDAISGML